MIAADPKDAEKNERSQLNEVPRIVVLYVEHNEVVVSKWIEGTKNESSRQSTEE